MPSNPDKLPGSKWTAVTPSDRRKHWQVVRVDKKSGNVELEAVLDNHRKRLAWRELRDRDRWRPGWE
jgi:tryptophan-rich hypothetical protein